MVVRGEERRYFRVPVWVAHVQLGADGKAAETADGEIQGREMTALLSH